MDRVKDLSHFIALTEEIGKRYKKIVSNSFLLPAAIEEMTSRKKLNYEIYDDALFFFCENDRFYMLYYYMAQKGNHCFRRPDKPVVAWVTFNSGRKPAYLEDVKERLEKCGLRFDFDMHNMDLTVGEHIKPERPMSPEFRIVTADPGHIEGILSLWHETDVLIDILIPSEKELARAVDAGDVFCVLDEADSVVGALEVEDRGNIREIVRISVDAGCRKKGVASALMIRGLDAAQKKGIRRSQVWMRADNKPTPIFYSKIGYKANSRDSWQFIME